MFGFARKAESPQELLEPMLNSVKYRTALIFRTLVLLVVPAATILAQQNRIAPGDAQQPSEMNGHHGAFEYRHQDHHRIFDYSCPGTHPRKPSEARHPGKKNGESNEDTGAKNHHRCV